MFVNVKTFSNCFAHRLEDCRLPNTKPNRAGSTSQNTKSNALDEKEFTTKLKAFIEWTKKTQNEYMSSILSNDCKSYVNDICDTFRKSNFVPGKQYKDQLPQYFLEQQYEFNQLLQTANHKGMP
jgi:hypothetical protein